MPISKQHFISNSPLIKNVRTIMRIAHLSIRTEDAYLHWIVDFIFFHGVKNPVSMAEREVTAYLSHLAETRHVAASTQNQAFNAILFLYNRVLDQPLHNIEAKRAQRPANVPEILTKDELKLLFDQMDGDYRTLAMLAYGTGLRLMELLSLRVKDIDLSGVTITVSRGKGAKGRGVPMPTSMVNIFKAQLAKVRAQHEIDLRDGYGSVWLPDALERKYPNASKDIRWQYFFPSKTICTDPRSGRRQRHHLFPTGFQTAVRNAASKAGILKRVSPHVFRHSFATHSLESGKSIFEVQQLLGHKQITTTQIYLHCVSIRKGQPTPVDCLCEH